MEIKVFILFISTYGMVFRFEFEFFIRLVSKCIRYQSEWHHIKPKIIIIIIIKKNEKQQQMRLEHKLLYHFLSDSAKIEHLFCVNCVISHTFSLHWCVVAAAAFLFLFYFSPSYFFIVEKLKRTKWNKQSENEYANKQEDKLHLQYLCIIALCTTHCRPFMLPLLCWLLYAFFL